MLMLSIIMAMKVIELRTMEILLNSIKLRISDGRGNGPLKRFDESVGGIGRVLHQTKLE